MGMKIGGLEEPARQETNHDGRKGRQCKFWFYLLTIRGESEKATPYFRGGRRRSSAELSRCVGAPCSSGCVIGKGPRPVSNHRGPFRFSRGRASDLPCGGGSVDVKWGGECAILRVCEVVPFVAAFSLDSVSTIRLHLVKTGGAFRFSRGPASDPPCGGDRPGRR